MANAVPTTFQTLLDELQRDCTRFGEGVCGKQQLRWMLGDETKPARVDLEKWREFFSRIELEKDYENAKAAGDVRQSAALATNLSDVMASMQRDFLMRHRSRLRRLAHEASAKQHFGSPDGYFVAGLLQYVLSQMQRVKSDE